MLPHQGESLLTLARSPTAIAHEETRSNLSTSFSLIARFVCVQFFVLTMPQHTPVADVALYSIVSIVLVLVAMLVLILGVAGYAIARALTSKKPPTNQAHNLRQVGSRPRPKYS